MLFNKKYCFYFHRRWELNSDNLVFHVISLWVGKAMSQLTDLVCQHLTLVHIFPYVSNLSSCVLRLLLKLRNSTDRQTDLFSRIRQSVLPGNGRNVFDAWSLALMNREWRIAQTTSHNKKLFFSKMIYFFRMPFTRERNSCPNLAVNLQQFQILFHLFCSLFTSTDAQGSLTCQVSVLSRRSCTLPRSVTQFQCERRL